MLGFKSLTSLVLLALTAAPSVLAATAGCGKAPISGNRSITVNGKQRQFIITLPQQYDNNKPHKLIFGYHWLGSTYNDVGHNRADQHYGLYALAQNSAIFVAPNGINNGWGNQGGEDITFFDEMIKVLDANLCIDETKRFSNGFSFGGGMSYSIACSRPNVIRAVAVYAGGQISGCDGGNGQVAYFGAHGIHDDVLPISMGRQLRDRFVRNNGCGSANPREPQGGTNQWFRTDYPGCAPGKPVTWLAYDDGHTATPRGGGATWLPQEVWKFFSQFDNETPGTNPNPGTGTTTTPVPNPITTPQPTPTQPAPGGNIPRWGQCGGNGWQGSGTCQSGSTCRFQNDWYSQCV